MLNAAQSEPGNEPHWLDDVELPAQDEWGRDPFDPRCHCLRCGHRWEKRLPFGQFPSACPGCKSPRWHRPPKQKGRPPALSTFTTEELQQAADDASAPLDWLLTASPKQLGRELQHRSRRCLRCTHKWRQRGDPNRLPSACPQCRSPRWFVPRQA